MFLPSQKHLGRSLVEVKIAFSRGTSSTKNLRNPAARKKHEPWLVEHPTCCGPSGSRSEPAALSFQRTSQRTGRAYIFQKLRSRAEHPRKVVDFLLNLIEKLVDVLGLRGSVREIHEILSRASLFRFPTLNWVGFAPLIKRSFMS